MHTYISIEIADVAKLSSLLTKVKIISAKQS